MTHGVCQADRASGGATSSAPANGRYGKCVIYLDKYVVIAIFGPMQDRIFQLFRSARLSRALTQADVARWAGIRQGDLSRFEHGKHDPRLSTLQRLAAALDLEVMIVPKEAAPRVTALLEPASSTAAPSLVDLYGVSDDDEEEV